MDRDASWRDDGVRHRDTEHHTHGDCGHLERQRQRKRYKERHGERRDAERETNQEIERDGGRP